MTKKCNQCRYMLHKDTFEVCTRDYSATEMFFDACEHFAPPTNGDKIIAGGTRAITSLICCRRCDVCIYANYENDSEPDIGGHSCDCPKGKTCLDGIEAWLDAPAKIEDEEK